MGSVEKISSDDAEPLLSVVRNQASDPQKIRESLRKLGEIAGMRVARKWFSTKREFMTPMQQSYSGVILDAVNVCVVSTSDEFGVFGAGVASCFVGCLRGQLDFHGRRGMDALRGPVDSYTLPEKRGAVDAVIVAKSVLATGCTAIRLLSDAQQEYTPKTLIIATIFYSERGIREVHEKYPHVQIVTFGEPDSLNEEGMLVPGVGNIDQRMSMGPVTWRERFVRWLASLLGVRL
jgi:uracil phosphoribosyltransferase